MGDRTITAASAGLIRSSAPARSPEAIAAAREGVLDFLASAFGGVGDRAIPPLEAALGVEGGKGSASVIGRRDRTAPLAAALLNGTIGHALDYDDVQRSVGGHPSTVILPALFALAEERGSTAEALLDAYVVGVEAMARIGLALGRQHYEGGFHPTATLGTIGAAAATAFLAGLDEAGTARALGLATTQSAGLRLQFGSDAKPLHAGLAARAGLFATRLALAGFGAADDAFDGPIGFLAVYGGEGTEPKRAVEGWGEPWQIVSPGLIFKRYACCSASHFAADAALALKAEHAIDPASVVEATVTFARGGDAALTVRRPRTGLEGRFSVEYVVAAVLTDGRLGLDLFADGPVRPELAALAAKVERRIDPDAPPVSNDPATRFSTVEIRLADGRVLSRRVDRPLPADDLAAKFRDAAGPAPTLAAVPEIVRSMRSRDDLAALFAAFRAA
ncbi:MmgE/PrpD family protein [Inquilinus limosus]|uniref:MmgE/PrpD family protein n=1 Tax=Inquilinus limosus TaxID=171674 RepID=UPI000402EE0D|nr:MmgE/PrpD family protein [Inquilinus limosus]